jgi:hypothetical protein
VILHGGFKGYWQITSLGVVFRMNPVVGLDISKGESQIQAFLDKGEPFRKSFKVSHTVEGLGT